MNLQHRIDLLVRLGQYILSADEEWLECKETVDQLMAKKALLHI